MGIFWSIGNYLLGSYTEYSFNLKAMKRLYIAKTKDNSLLNKADTIR